MTTLQGCTTHVVDRGLIALAQGRQMTSPPPLLHYKSSQQTVTRSSSLLDIAYNAFAGTALGAI